MISNLHEKLWLKQPIDFYGICTIYPLTIKDYLELNKPPAEGQHMPTYSEMFVPFTINHAFLKDAGVDYNGDIWDFFFMDAGMLAQLTWTIGRLTHTDNNKIDIEGKRIMLSETQSLGADKFQEFADIVLLAHGLERYKPQKKYQPKFKSKAEAERYKKYQAARAKHQAKHEDEDKLLTIIQYVQLASSSYIPDEEILTWTYWKLMRWYNKLILKENHDELHACFAHWGGKDVKKSLDKLKTEIMTKI